MFRFRKKEEDEFVRMRVELMDECNRRFAERCNQGFQDFYELLRASLASGEHFDHAEAERAKRDSERALEAAQMECEQIRTMSDGEVKQLYHETFGRWHTT